MSRRRNKPDPWTVLRTANITALPGQEWFSTKIAEYQDDAGDILVFIGTEETDETFDEAVSRAIDAGKAIDAIPFPTAAEAETRRPKPKTLLDRFWAKWAGLRRDWELGGHVNHFKKSGSDDPEFDAFRLIDLHEDHIKAFKIYAAKRLFGGHTVEESKEAYYRNRMNGEFYGGDKRAVKSVIDNMQDEDVFTPSWDDPDEVVALLRKARAKLDADFAALLRQAHEDAKRMSMSPTQAFVHMSTGR